MARKPVSLWLGVRFLATVPCAFASGELPPGPPAVFGDAAFDAARASIQRVKLAAKSRPRPLNPAEQARLLVKKALRGTRIPASYVDQAFDDPRLCLIPEIVDKFKDRGLAKPPIPYEEYRSKFVVKFNVHLGAKFVKKHRGLLDAIEARYGVDGALLAALVSRETNYGTNVGKYPVFSALNTIAQLVPVRSEWAVKEIVEFLKMTHSHGLDPHAVVGAYDGGIGYVQFEPSSINIHAVDFDGDGRIRLDEWPDALASAANYLAKHGYQRDAAFTPESPIGRSLFAYNHSNNYVRAILELRQEIQKRFAAGNPQID